MSTRDEDEARAEAWLRAQGYEPARPEWLPPGKNPDFWAESLIHTPHGIWAEVKSIEPDDSTAAMGRFASIIGSARIPPNLYGHAMVHLEPHAVEQSVRWVLKAFAARSPEFSGKNISLMFLQQTRDCTQEYRVDIDSETPMTVWARGTGLPLNPGTAIQEDALYATARVTRPDGTEITGPAYRFFEPRFPMQCALVARLRPGGPKLADIAYMCGGSGQTRERTARVIEGANGQIKTACMTRDTAGIVVLTPSGPFGDNDQMMQAAIYGQYTVPIHMIEDRLSHGDMFHGVDGVFRPNKNTHVSAALHLRREGPATFFPNPFARHVIPDDAGLFVGARRAEVDFV